MKLDSPRCEVMLRNRQIVFDQHFYTVANPDPHWFGRLNPDPNWKMQIRIREVKHDPQKWVKLKTFHILKSAGCSRLSAEGFSCYMDVLYSGHGVSKLQFSIIFSICIFFYLCSSKPMDPERIRIEPVRIHNTALLLLGTVPALSLKPRRYR
jgi:hypothetical protein